MCSENRLSACCCFVTSGPGRGRKIYHAQARTLILHFLWQAQAQSQLTGSLKVPVLTSSARADSRRCEHNYDGTGVGSKYLRQNVVHAV